MSLSSPCLQQVTVNYSTTPINATANVDYTTKTGTLVIAANTSTATISIPILNDNVNEPDEAFTLTLCNPLNAIIDPEAGIGQVIVTDTLNRATTSTLPSGVENLTLIGTAAINATGNAADNLITGNSGNNILNGGAGKDTLTGSGGNDRFGYTTLSDSLLSNYDVITEYNNGDQIDASIGVIAATLTNSVGTVANLNALSTVLTNSVFTANIAKAFKVTGIGGTFIALNDTSAGFNAATDSIIFLQNYTGPISVI